MTLIDKNHYKHFFEDIKRGIQSARVSAAKSVNKELIKLYLHIGQQIVEKQEKFGWGKSVVEILASDLQKEFENTDGFSARNLWNMRMFYLQYRNNEFLLQAVAEIPWGHNLLIMNKITDQNEREYYIKATIENGWSRNVLGLQIKSNAYQRHMLTAEKENFEVEYAIRGFSKPMGVAEYKLTKELPSEFKGTLPTPQELKKELFQKQEK